MLADVASVLAWGALWLMASHLADACEAADATLCRVLNGCFFAGFILSLVDFVIEAGMATLLERLSWRAPHPKILTSLTASPLRLMHHVYVCAHRSLIITDHVKLSTAQPRIVRRRRHATQLGNHAAEKGALQLIIVSGAEQTLWLEALRKMLLAAGVLASSLLAYQLATGPRMHSGFSPWRRFGGAVSALALVTSWLEFLRVWEFFGTSLPGIVLDITLDGLVLPVWVVWLGVLLSSQGKDAADRAGGTRERRGLSGLDSYYDDL